MQQSGGSTAKFIVDDFRIAYLFDIPEPIPEDTLSKAMEKHGFTIQKMRYFTAPNSPIRVTILNIGTKGKISVLYQKDTVPTFVGVSGRDTTEALKQFSIIEELLREVDPPLLQQSTGIEAIITAKQWSVGWPDQAIPKLAGDRIKGMSGIVGTPVKLISVLIAPEKDSPDEFWSLRIEPVMASPKYYFLQYVIRGISKEKVMTSVYKSAELIKDVIEHIEV